mmetsp:Transcript_2911/g.8318  ORF Transcript_2911/g.8318 Transcript_2911/m.8318 type:complete len:204 (+) Transcript_2911:398-1009(+)
MRPRAASGARLARRAPLAAAGRAAGRGRRRRRRRAPTRGRPRRWLGRWRPTAVRRQWTRTWRRQSRRCRRRTPRARRRRPGGRGTGHERRGSPSMRLRQARRAALRPPKLPSTRARCHRRDKGSRCRSRGAGRASQSLVGGRTRPGCGRAAARPHGRALRAQRRECDRASSRLRRRPRPRSRGSPAAVPRRRRWTCLPSYTPQ